MRTLLALVGAVAAVSAPAAPSDRSVLAPAAVTELAADGERGARIAFRTRAPGSRCEHVRVWSLSQRSVTHLGRGAPCGPVTSTGSGLYGLSFGRETAAWATYTGGNIREYSLWLVTSRGRRDDLVPRPRRVASIRRDVDAPSPLVVGSGDGSLSYAVDAAVYVLTAEDRRLVGRVTSPAVALDFAYPYFAATQADGSVTVLLEGDARPALQLTYEPGTVRAVKLHGSTVVVLRRGALEVHAVHGSLRATWTLPAARSYGDGACGVPFCPRAELRLEDVHGNLAVYVLRNEVHLLRLTDGRDVVIRRPVGGPVEAQLEATGLSLSAGRRVAFVPLAEVQRALVKAE